MVDAETIIMKRKNLLRIIVPSILALVGTGFGIAVSQANGAWVFDSNKNQASADVGDINVPDWNFGSRPDINAPGYYDEFGNIVRNVDKHGNYLTFQSTYITSDGYYTDDSPMALSYYYVNWVNGAAKFTEVEFPAYYAEYSRDTGSLLIHPITDIGVGWTFTNSFNSFKVVLPPTATKIASRAFYGTQIRNVSFTSENNIETIGSDAFRSATFTDSALFGNKLFSIDQYAFYQATFNNIDLKNNTSLKTIGYGAFAEASIGTLDMTGTDITTIGEESFRNCRKLNTVNFTNAKIDTIGKGAFKWNYDANVIFSNAKIRAISEYAFNSCNISGTVDLRNSGIESIGQYSFAYQQRNKQYKTNLYVHIPGTISYIGSGFIRGCQNYVAVSLYNLSYQTESNFASDWDYSSDSADTHFYYYD